jgi:hypothetical protein
MRILHSDRLEWSIRIGLPLALVAALRASATPITYEVDRTVQSTLHVTGTITTDGSLGALSTANLTAWSLTVSAGSSSTPLTQDNSSATITGDWLVATSTALFFEFVDVTNTTTVLDGLSISNYGGFWNLQQNASATVVFGDMGAVLVPEAGREEILVRPLGIGGGFYGTAYEPGTQQIAAAIPETSTALGCSLGILGLSLRRRWRNSHSQGAQGSGPFE